MLKPEDRPLLGLVAALIAIVLVAYGPFESPSQQTVAMDQGNKSAKEHPAAVAVPDAADDRIARYTWWLSAFTLALVVVSGLQITFLIRADQTAKGALDLSRSTARAQLRAYVFHTGFMILPVKARGDLTFQVTLKNFGATPAYRVSWKAQYALFEGRKMPAYPLTGPASAEATIGPGHEIPMQTSFDTPPETELSKIASRETTLHFWGTITYLDAFGTWQKTEFRVFYEDTTDGRAFLQADEGNYAT